MSDETHPPDLTCKHCVDLLCDYLDGALDGPKKAAVEEHLAHCPPCVEFVHTYEHTPKLCRRALVHKIPSELGDRLMGFLRGKLKA